LKHCKLESFSNVSTKRVVEQIESCITELTKDFRKELAGIGIGAPGVVTNGVVKYPPNFKVWKEVNLKKHFETVSPYFMVAIASPEKRKKMAMEIKNLGGINVSYFSSQAIISPYSEISEQGVIIQLNSQVSSDVILEEGAFLNVRCMLGHDVKIGKYTTLSPDVKILGNVTIGENCVIATGATIMPKVKIGNNVRIGMNKLITKDIPDNTDLF
jgi:acetyltransferase-like isoleucine patch superfamily enzyme